MLLKWSDKEDQQLARIIRKYGTNDWALIRKQFKSGRSRDSVIKRWHGKLKFEKNNAVKLKKTPIQKSRTQPQNRRAREITRSAQVEKKKAKAPVQQNAQKNKFQRLRNFLEGTKGTRSKREKEEQEDEEEADLSEELKDSSSLQEDCLLEWNKADDEKLRSLVIQEGITSWQKIAGLMGCPQKQVRYRWRKAIYQMIKLDDKVGGFLKYSAEEDAILTIGHRNGLNWEQLMTFLPGRSQFSIEARWRRLIRPELEIELSRNKHYLQRQFLKKIIQKKRGERENMENLLQPENTIKTS